MSTARKEWQNPDVILKAIGVERGMIVADLGCGPGFFTIPFVSMVGASGLVYAVDADPIMLRYLQENIIKFSVEQKSVQIVRADVSQTGIPAKSVNIAFFANILHDIQDRRLFFEEVKRICKPTAVVVDVDWKKAQTGDGPPLDIRLSEEEAKRLLTANRFDVVKQIEAGPHHYTLVCKLAS